MSTLNVSNITDGTDTVETSYVLNGSAKIWCNFNGVNTIVTRDSFNLSSLTDNGAGHYRINISNSFANANYASPTSAGDATAGAVRTCLPHDGNDVTASYYDIQVDNSSGTATDAERVQTTSFGDLA